MPGAPSHRGTRGRGTTVDTVTDAWPPGEAHPSHDASTTGWPATPKSAKARPTWACARSSPSSGWEAMIRTASRAPASVAKTAACTHDAATMM